MKHLKDFKNELNKCSKCGLCQSVCPLFKLDPNDCVVSKGKFIMLHGVTKGELELSKNINKYIDMCLKCGKCNSFCPSGIDVCEILNIAKAQYMESKPFGKIINFLQSRAVFTNFIKIFSQFTNPFRVKLPVNPHADLNLVYFKGCVNKLFPQTDNYIKKIFKNLDVNIITPEFDCCGLPFLSEGNIERFIQAAEDNLKNIGTDYDYLVTDCASCESTILEYPKYLESIQDFVRPEKSVNWGDIIALKDLKFRFEKKIKVTFHRPCHLKNDAFFERVIRNCENAEYIKMQDYDACCGLAGTFCIKNSKMSSQLMRQKAQNIIDSGADIVVTTCPACIMGIKMGLVMLRSNIRVKSLLEFLSEGVI